MLGLGSRDIMDLHYHKAYASAYSFSEIPSLDHFVVLVALDHSGEHWFIFGAGSQRRICRILLFGACTHTKVLKTHY